MIIRRFDTNPIIRPGMDARMGDNINGPSLIRVPDWLTGALGRYYLYFAHHDGHYIRLAYADDLAGPWSIHELGTLALNGSHFKGHIASPDVHVEPVSHQIRMYYHGADEATGVAGSVQRTRVAVSSDGLHFTASQELLALPYFRAFAWGGKTYGLAMPGVFFRSTDGLTGFEQGPTLFSPDMRHSAVKLDGDTLTVFYSKVGDAPERILAATIELTADWNDWRPSPAITVLQPDMAYEGAALANEPSVRGLEARPVRQLRDPAIYREDGRTYLLYAVAGEQGIAIAELGQA